jgi:ATPase subunit of ABC transporter with duplicated ATPase domains
MCGFEGARVYLPACSDLPLQLVFFPRLAKDPYMLAQLRNVSLSFPDKQVLDDVSLTIYPGDRISLVGENGAGKTSLFRLLKGHLAPDSGEVSLSRGVRIGYLEQDFAGMDEDPRRTCMGVALEPFEPLLELEEHIELLAFELGESRVADTTSGLLADLGEAQQRFEVLGGYEFRAKTESTLTGLGLPESFWDRRVSELSAGQRVRLALARILLEDHDLILFDEPTNHLDVPAREWLEGHLAGGNFAYVVASHDRRFLDAVSSKVAHIDRGKLTLYSGDYTAFRRQLRQAEEEWWRRYEKSRKLAKKLQRQAQDYQRWSEAGEKKKRGAADKGFVGHKAAKVMKRSLVARRRMEEAVENARTEKPFEKDAVKIVFGSSKGRSLVPAEELVVGYSEERPLTGELSSSRTFLEGRLLRPGQPARASRRECAGGPPRHRARRDPGPYRHGQDGHKEGVRQQEGGGVELRRARQGALGRAHPRRQRPPRPRRTHELPRHRDPGCTTGGAQGLPRRDTLRRPRPLLRGRARYRDPDARANIGT